MGRVEDKVVLITGGASNPGLGFSAALALAREGAKVAVTDVDESGAKRCAEAIKAAGGHAISMAHDVTDEKAWQRAVDATLSSFGGLNVLVNNAGIAVLKPLESLSLDDWNRQISVNLTSVFLGCKAAIAPMRRAGGGSIVNLSSVAGLVGLATCAAYGASKGGVRMMTKAIAAEFGKEQIRCNSVHPGVIWTNMQSAASGRDRADTMASSLPLGHVGKPDDIANCIVYLSSDESAYVTGAEFVIDGGMTAV